MKKDVKRINRYQAIFYLLKEWIEGKAVLQEVKSIVEEVSNHLHSHPEISRQEVETTRYLQRLLESEGFKLKHSTTQ